MAHMNIYLLKISFRKYGMHYNKLTKEQKRVVLDIYYDFY